MNLINIGLIGDFSSTVTAHIAIPKAVELSASKLNCNANMVWLATDSIYSEKGLKKFDGLWSVPNTPYKNMNGALIAIKYARENKIPFLGTCGGFQHAVVEYFRNVLNINEAGHLEVDPGSKYPVITQLSCALVEKDGEIFFNEGSLTKKLYAIPSAKETYHCSYGFNPDFIELLKNSNLKISGYDKDGEIRVLELEDHPFFIGTLFQPERSALKGKDHPLINAFVSASNSKSEIRNSKSF